MGFKEGCVLDRLDNYEEKMMKDLYYSLFDRKTNLLTESLFFI